jgi:hypothetical protein
MFVLAFVFNNMSSFQMESLQVMEKFDGGNFHLWKFKMHMMLSKHGFWKFIDENATICNDENEMANYNEKIINAFALLCEHVTNAQLAHIQYCEMSKAFWRHFMVCMKPRLLKIICFFEGGYPSSKCNKGNTCLHT